MTLSRTHAVVLTVSVSVLLGGCGDADPAPESPAVAASPAPAADAVWEYWGSRQPGENGAIDIGGGRVDSDAMRAVTSWDETR